MLVVRNSADEKERGRSFLGHHRRHQLAGLVAGSGSSRTVCTPGEGAG